MSDPENGDDVLSDQEIDNIIERAVAETVKRGKGTKAPPQEVVTITPPPKRTMSARQQAALKNGRQELLERRREAREAREAKKRGGRKVPAPAPAPVEDDEDIIDDYIPRKARLAPAPRRVAKPKRPEPEEEYDEGDDEYEAPTPFIKAKETATKAIEKGNAEKVTRDYLNFLKL
jgi:hypothetical protein